MLFRYLEHYRYPPEANQLIRLVRALDEGHDVTSCTEYRIGHVTIGGIAVDRDLRVLLVRHTEPERWLTPSGPLDPRDVSLVGASLRELERQTGIRARDITSSPDEQSAPFDIDVRSVPATNDVPEHVRFDFRYAHWVDEADVRPLIGDSARLSWLPAEELHPCGLKSKLSAVGVG
ncbi:NUDIX domain-containing protein [Halostreptopolyspora alba]|uniref:NUDIX domain-containing protein n=1 Tax=Halostreptopolyspora alba TaxID=2487137 RepID=UPI00371E69C9